jgi:UDPglucose 6-dehydrogenase
MKITIIGTGYVGLVVGACFADSGHEVCCVDINVQKVDSLNKGVVPLYEPGLQEIVQHNLKHSRLVFTCDTQFGVQHGEIIFIAVDTPAKEDGSADLQHVLNAAKGVAEYLQGYKIIVNKSTVPVGTVDKVTATIQQQLVLRDRQDIDFDVCSNPEFLKEGAAVADFRKPDRIVIGHRSQRVESVMRQLYAPFNRNHKRLIFMDPCSAELTKYAANAMLATKISFINEIAAIAEHVGADIESIRLGIGADPRIGYHFIYAGCGYGGSCFPKDVKALASIARQNNSDSQLLEAVENVNELQKQRMLQRVLSHFSNDVSNKKLAVWGLSFKPGTDDVREATSAVVISGLLACGAQITAYDPHANKSFKQRHPGLQNISYCEDMMSAIEGADGLIICTEWRDFWSPDFTLIKDKLISPVIFDGRNVYDPQLMAQLGFTYYGVGRGQSVIKNGSGF